MEKMKEEGGWRARRIRTKEKGNKISERVIIQRTFLFLLEPKTYGVILPVVFSFLMPDPCPAFLNVYVV